jgi:hypothetical protein
MPAINFSGQTIAITGVTGTVLSCASTAGLYTGLIGTMVDSTGANSTRVSLQQILTATTLVCKFQSIPAGATFTTYNGGKVFFDSQVVSVPSLYGTNLPVYANNAAAITGGLVVGSFYRTGADPDPVCVVH